MEKKVDVHFLKPNADIDEYFLHIYPDTPPKCTKGFVGYVGNRTNEKIKIRLEIDTPWMRERNYRSCCLYINDIYEESIIVMTADFFEFLRNNEFMDSAIWHEIGHFHLNHYFNFEFIGTSANNQRMEYFEKGEIMPAELAADIFALYYMSKEDVIEELNWTIKTRRNLVWEPDETKTRAVKELCMRKKKIKSLDDSDDSIRKVLCELCRAADFSSL